MAIKLSISILTTVLVSCAVAGTVPQIELEDDSYMHPLSADILNGIQEEYEGSEFWRDAAQTTLKGKVANDQRIEGEAKNLIMFLGDGWGITTLTAARILKGQKVDESVKWGEEANLHVDGFPFTGLSKTFCADYQTAESACTATAYLCGTKANADTIGVTTEVKKGDCKGQQNKDNHVQSVLAWAQAAGKSTGVITTTRITHASPAGAYAHIADRDWEADVDVVESSEDPNFCDDIAEQLILGEVGKRINVILGGGRRNFVTKSEGGKRTDGHNLIDTWYQQKSDASLNAQVLRNSTDLRNVDTTKTDYLLGLFSSSHMSYYHDQEKNGQPSLAEMVEKAIEILSKNPKGFFLFVEGGRIDHAHHDNMAQRSLWETVEFDRAIKTGDDMTSDLDTLIVATADHSHAFSVGGYSKRGNPITGYGGLALDGVQRPTLNYANGPGWKEFTGGRRHDIGKDDMDNIDYETVPLIPLSSETHGAEDVGIFAKGPFAHYLTGVNLQNYIPHVMGYAGCIGEGLKYCDQKLK